MDPDTKELKKRVVLDMSRHINSCLVAQDVQMDDLKATEALRGQRTTWAYLIYKISVFIFA
jgi:hypothetical protein